jgi:hypothetical protein
VVLGPSSGYRSTPRLRAIERRLPQHDITAQNTAKRLAIRFFCLIKAIFLGVLLFTEYAVQVYFDDRPVLLRPASERSEDSVFGLRGEHGSSDVPDQGCE